MTSSCGVVAVIGAPNAGKSTLVNQLVGQKVAITSAKAQTTRAKLMGIALHDEAQIILVDTPGIFEPKRRLDRSMVNAAWEGTQAADAVLLVVDPIKQRRHELMPLLEALKDRPERKLLVLNKVDASPKEKLLQLAQEFAAAVDFAEVFFVSALTGDGVPELKAHLASLMPEGPWHYPEDQVSDASERLLAAEVTREQLYRQLHDELPYDSAVRHEQYLDLDPDDVVRRVGKPCAIIDCFCVLDDAKIRRYFELGCEVKGLGRGHVKRIKEGVKTARS